MQSQSIKQGGDDLDDDFVLDELVALSDNEGPGDARLDDEDVFVNADDVQDGDENEESGETTVNANSALAKKRKRREKEKERKAKVCCFTFYLVSYSN